MAIEGRGSTMAFFVGFVVCYYGTLIGAYSLLRVYVDPIWPMISRFEHRIIVALAICPVLSFVLFMITSSTLLLTSGEMGRYFMTPRKFFAIGWFAALVANFLVIHVGVRWAIDPALGTPWVGVVGIPRFNLVFFVVAPTAGFVGGAALSTLAAAIASARNE